MGRPAWGYLYWGAGWLLVGFLVAELAGYLQVAPWPTLSETVWFAERYRYVRDGVFALLLALMAHFLFRRPLWHSVLFAVIVACAAHVADRSWP